jgi:pimeloyl-ACP methyl ester carboxylesterase
MERAMRVLAVAALLGAALAIWGWRSGDQEPVDVVAETRARLGIPLESGFFETNGVRLHVVQAGPETGPPVLLLHGFPEFWWTWNAQIAALARAGFRVIAPDQRGFNLSDKPPHIDDYRPEERRADVLGLLDALGHERASIAGHDFGAFVAWGLAIEHPERLRKVVVMNVAHPTVYASPPPGRPETINWFRTFFRLPLLPELVGRSGNWFLLERNLLKSSRPGTFADPAMRYYKHAWAHENAIHSMLAWYRAGFRHPYRPAGPARVSVPMRIVWGGRDVFNDPSYAEPSLAFCDDAELVSIPDGGHWLNHEKPDEISRLLIEFFGEPRAASR